MGATAAMLLLILVRPHPQQERITE
jgi:hypothetical protein